MEQAHSFAPATGDPLAAVPGHLPIAFERISSSTDRAGLDRDVAQEFPVAIEINGFGYAVLMATPLDLEDLIYGFLRAERLAATARQILATDCYRLEAGYIVRITVDAAVAERLTDRVRHRTSDSSCGLCGVENLEQAMRALPHLTATSDASSLAVFRALGALSDHQPLNRMTGGVHAAALCDAAGHIRLVREDVGRHNAFDKLIGAMMRQGLDWDGGFALLSSRCSYELVEKAVLSQCPMLVTISAPTSLALARAREAGLDLRVLARPDSLLSPALPA
ncbi:formate dehydrogenase accessory sulfurtransferase FdhD [Novosphingobium sp. JCM 18896]|uniref:formate dehydrogenase accessory sulfurtransferase FdhD n=1 Tax=Novosphingobium sp. JCM 18896 TaxID=2989731 RepID=UPI0022221405|nr:formate dehydrogenase accessory sulfurtransferase FdhD [Novosphingobium sp. JCM 18896]MCW1430248.1 formate dehydrogenase accessory sulfurtransferase FdhD [Novosphingobium sp. JCM 18896]